MILALQTICKTIQVLTLEDTGTFMSLYEWKYYKGNDHMVLKIIDDIIDDYKDQVVSSLIVVNGKGSYTGTRLGVSTINALAFGWNIPVGVCTTKEYIGDQSSFDLEGAVKTFLKNPLWQQQATPVYNREPKIG